MFDEDTFGRVDFALVSFCCTLTYVVEMWFNPLNLVAFLEGDKLGLQNQNVFFWSFYEDGKFSFSFRFVDENSLAVVPKGDGFEIFILSGGDGVSFVDVESDGDGEG